MYKPEIKFGAPEYDGAEDNLGTLPDKLAQIMNHLTKARIGERALQDPTDIEITPLAIEGEQLFIVRSWHETATSADMIGVLQPTEAVFDLVVDKTDAYLHNRAEEGANYKLSTVEAITLHDLGRLAATHDMLSSPVGRETT